jgi:hypothetical protein
MASFDKVSLTEKRSANIDQLKDAVERLKENRQHQEVKVDSSNMMLPLLLIGGAFFLLSS